MREREDASRTREAGNRDEVEGVVANTLNLFRNGAVGSIVWLGGSVICEPSACPQEMVQFFFPSLHESLIIISREFGHELVASGTNAGVAVSNICKTSIAVSGKLDLQPTSGHPGRDLQHLNEPSCGLMALARAIG